MLTWCYFRCLGNGYFITIGAKFYSTNIRGKTHQDNMKTCDLYNSFGKGPSKLREEYQKRVKDGSILIRGQLQLAIEFPRVVPKCAETSYVKGNNAIVFINNDNMDEIFREDFSDPRINVLMKRLKAAIKSGMLYHIAQWPANSRARTLKSL